MYLISCDPGISGAIAIFENNDLIDFFNIKNTKARIQMQRTSLIFTAQYRDQEQKKWCFSVPFYITPHKYRRGLYSFSRRWDS